MKRLIVALTLVLFVSSFLCADVYVKTVQRTEAYEMMGEKRPENVEIVEMWLAKNKSAQISKMVSIIIDYEKEKLYFIVHPQKIYFELPTTIDRTKLHELLPPKIAQIISSITVTDAKVNLTGQTKKVANWNCYGADFEMVFMIPALNMMPKFKMKMWMTEDVPFNYEAYTRQSEFFERFVFGILNVDDNSKKELEKLDTVKGFQVSTEVTLSIFGTEIKAVTQCLEVAVRPAPAGVYSAPRGYTKRTIPPPPSVPPPPSAVPQPLTAVPPPPSAVPQPLTAVPSPPSAVPPPPSAAVIHINTLK